MKINHTDAEELSRRCFPPDMMIVRDELNKHCQQGKQRIKFFLTHFRHASIKLYISILIEHRCTYYISTFSMFLHILVKNKLF